ncbi:hypothetical protein [Hymenobacter weizhouensis]|uniref:hypothetical protein n=1 Tax=Hymenobacter sp. YIM 151500-1 TaxID=2987689 RepID=UPI0022266E85|nr:hypothetical protein [Hymenobacter sp. YIM 151500-1]UYZ63801.1 hypothetical protein OIS53_02915 [Hymenobacter sp. YIM 151500-1]
MFKKLIQTLLLGVFLGMVPLGCCKDEPREYVTVRGLKLYLSEPAPGSPLLNSGARTSAPELLTTVRLEYNYVAAAPVGALFTSQAVAWSCEAPGRKGLKDKVTAVTFTSTGLFNGVAAGQPLNQFVRCSGGRSYHQGAEFALAYLADSLNSWKSGEYGDLNTPLYLRISPKPRDNAHQQFQLRLRFASGHEVVQTAPDIRWD